MTREEQIKQAAMTDRRVALHSFRRAFTLGAEWADAHPQDRWISVEDELPAYDREVVVLIQDYPDDNEHLRVAFGHRPNPNGWVTKDGERLYAMTYDKGGWNGKNIRYWLDVKLPNEG